MGTDKPENRQRIMRYGDYYPRPHEHHIEEQVDYLGALDTWLHGYTIVEIEDSGMFLIQKSIVETTLDEVPFRVRADQIRPSSDDPPIVAWQRQERARRRCAVRRKARRMGMQFPANAPVQLTPDGGRLTVCTEVEIAAF